jgi:TolA-binding protein
MATVTPSYFDKLAEQTSKNKTAILGLIVFAIVIAAVYVIYDYQKTKKEEAAQTAYYDAERLLNVDIPKADAKKNEKPAPVDTTQTEQKLKELMKEYPNTNAAFQSALLLGQIYSQQNKPAQAIEVLESKANEKSHSDLIDAILILKLSSLYEQNKQCDKAVSVLDKIAKQSETMEFKPEALLRQALCQETLGQKDKAKDTYQKLSTEFSDTEQGQQAAKYLKLLTDKS